MRVDAQLIPKLWNTTRSRKAVSSSPKTTKVHSETVSRYFRHTWCSEERKDTSKYAPDSRHTCYRARSVELKGVDDVVERGLEYHQETSTQHYSTDARSGAQSASCRVHQYLASQEAHPIQCTCLLEVHPNKNRPPAKRIPPTIIGGNRASGTGRMLFASSFLT